jgi:hypothetical protein
MDGTIKKEGERRVKFGKCPKCGGKDAYFVSGRFHWLVCRGDRMFWPAAVDLSGARLCEIEHLPQLTVKDVRNYALVDAAYDEQEMSLITLYGRRGISCKSGRES